MRDESTHNVPHGKSIVEKMTDLLDEALAEWMKSDQMEETDELRGKALGIAACLGIWRSTDAGVEFEAALNRYQNVIVVGEKGTGHERISP